MKFHGKVGYGQTMETSPGVYEDIIVEREYYGDLMRASRQFAQGEYLNPDLSLGNMVSVVADSYANENFFNIRYVEWRGVRWTVSNVEIYAPRLTMYLGKVYNGPTAPASIAPQ
jgi:hypothetical protein